MLGIANRRVMKIEKPRPLKISSLGDQSLEAVLSEMDSVTQQLNAEIIDRSIYPSVTSLCTNLKMFGPQLESVYKDQLDRCYIALRNGCRDDRLNLASRYRLLEVIELRAMHWQPNENLINYYKQKLAQVETDEAVYEEPLEMTGYMTPTSILTPTGIATSPMYPPQYTAYVPQQVIYTPPPQHVHPQIPQVQQVAASPQQLLLGPGEVVKSSGKYAKPTRIPGKNYFKDEIVIRNPDSGKVMGIKGRRVHMIEELSETIISFQRVSPGTKERLVQITGPTDENISHAKQLIEETIRRNASPIRGDDTDAIFTSLGGSSSSISSHTSDETLHGSKRNTLLVNSFGRDDPLGEYRYTVTHNNDIIRITGNNFHFVRTAKLVLDEYFNGERNLNNISSLVSLDGSVTPPSPPASVSPPADSPIMMMESNRAPSISPPPELSLRSSKENLVTVIRQPLIPFPSKEAIENAESASSLPAAVRTRRALFAMTSKERANQQISQDNVTPDAGSLNSTVALSPVPTPCSEGSVTPVHNMYSREFLICCADSPYARQTPKDWGNVVRKAPVVIRKSWLHLPSLLSMMDEKGDACLSEIPSYLQEGDFATSTELLKEKTWSLVREASLTEDDNGNSN